MRENPTVVLMTHQPEEAARAGRAVVLGGRPASIAADLTLEERPSERSTERVAAVSAILSEHLANRHE